MSDNNGDFDTNDDVKNNSWFWKYLKKDAIYYSLEIKFKNIMQLKKQIKITLSNLGKS